MSDINPDVVARMQQLESQGAGKNEGWDKVIGSNSPTGNTRSLQSTEVKQAANLLNNTYVDRRGVEHVVDQDGNAIYTGAAVIQYNVVQSDTGASYVKMNAITDQKLVQANAVKAYESGDGEQMRYAINETLVANFAIEMDAHKSSPDKVWKDVQAYAEANKTSNERKVFNEVLAGGTGAERQEAINSLIQDFKSAL